MTPRPSEPAIVVDWDAPIEMDDGVVLRADVYRPDDEGSYPALLSYGPYGKELHFPDGYPDAWRTLIEAHPDVEEGSSNRYQAWEVCDPERWVPDGYVCVRVDARGWGRSPGVIDPYAPRGSIDLHDCIEWAAAQPWCSGKVGLLGISYYAITQWLVAGLRPPHLTAMIPWEGVSDFYRDMFDAKVDGEMRGEDGFLLTFVSVGPHSEINLFEIDGNDEAAKQVPMFGRGRLDHIGLQAASLEAFDEIRDRLMATGATDGFVTDFGRVLSLFFRDPDGLEGEVCVMNPDWAGEYNPPGTPSLLSGMCSRRSASRSLARSRSPTAPSDCRRGTATVFPRYTSTSTSSPSRSIAARHTART